MEIPECPYCHGRPLVPQKKQFSDEVELRCGGCGHTNALGCMCHGCKRKRERGL
jgi:hypothetical protein